MIYGKITLEDWRTVCVEGEEPESSFESYNLRLFFFGTLYNRDTLQATPDDTNAKLAADAFLSDPAYGFSRLDGSFTIVYYSENECGVVRDHHGTHYPVYCHIDGNFATSWQFLEDQLEENFEPNLVSLSTFLQRGILKKNNFALFDVHSLGAGEKFYMLTELGYLMPVWASVKLETQANVHSMFDSLKERNPGLYEKVADDIYCLKRDSVFEHEPKVATERNPDVEAYSRRYGELHAQAIRRRIGHSRRVGILLSGEYEIDGTETSALPDIVRFLGEPFMEGGLMVNYCAMRMIGDDKPDVILGGDGSDQYFGTSGREVALHYLSARIGLRPLLRGISRLLEHETFDTGGKLSRINFHLDKILHILEGERFGFSDSALCALLQNPKEDFEPVKSLRPDIHSFEHLYAQHAILSDLETVINRIILFKASSMARMFGNNLTYPFMDLELFHFRSFLQIMNKLQRRRAVGSGIGRTRLCNISTC